MSEFNIEVQGGSSVRLPTAGKYCEKDIIVTASGGGGTEEIENLIDQSGVLDSTEGTVEDKVGRLVDKADIFNKASGISFVGTKYEAITLDCATFTSLYGAFNECRTLKEVHLTNTENITDWRSTFYTVPKLHTIETVDFSGYNSNSAWSVMPALTTFKVVSNTLKKSIVINAQLLSNESIQSIFGGLNSEVTGQTLTIPRNAVKKAFGTSEGANDGDTSETWNALVASKPNWTITLS